MVRRTYEMKEQIRYERANHISGKSNDNPLDD
jgi:hypothetical protein